jgi:hypothetical protein
MRSLLFTFYLLSVGIALGQIPQAEPSLCGKQNSIPQSRQDYWPSTNTETGAAEFSIKIGGSIKKLAIPAVVDAWVQVCPVSGGRIVAFGTAANGYNVNIIDTNNGELIDSFYARGPVISPDGRWLAFLKFYPRGMVASVSEEYLLYDLQKDKLGNRGPGIGPDDRDSIGKTVYPLGYSNTPGNHIGLSEDELHTSHSAFYWAPNSRTFVFADSVNDQLSVVQITIENGGKTSAYVHNVGASEACQGSFQVAANVTFKADFSSASDGSGDIRAQFLAGGIPCAATPLVLNRSDFSPAHIEKPTELPRRKRSVVEQ